MGYQFIHLETYSRSGSKTKHNIRGILKEAKREPTHCVHVLFPQTPEIIFQHPNLAVMSEKTGKDPFEMLEMVIEAQASKAVDAKGRKLRKDANLLLAGVSSYPVPMEELRYDREEQKNYQEWLDHVQKFLKKTYGERLQLVVSHVDEKFPHVHFYATPKLTKDNRLEAAKLHPGVWAQSQIKYSRENGKERRAAYIEAMRRFQDHFYTAVALPCGLARLGPKRRRLTREEWKEEQNRSSEVAQVVKIFPSLIDDFEAVMEEVQDSASVWKKMETILDKLRLVQRALSSIFKLEALAQGIRNIFTGHRH